MTLEDKFFHNLLRGRFKNIPKDRAKVVRIFLSSTFTDTHEERDYLIENAFPKLKVYCKQQYGLDFHIVDMRWGISHEATNNHLATTICINEIKNCQKYSLGPNFVGFLSHRYGTRVLPTRIIADEYQILKNEMLTNSDFDLKYEIEELKIENIVDFCYKLDENEIPFRYRLQNLSFIFPNYNDKNPEYSKMWEDLQFRMSKLFRTAADNCFQKGQINEVQHERYFASVTEKEIFNGILTAKDVKKNCVFFVREIEDIKEHIGENVKLVRRFIDLDDSGNLDLESDRLLTSLKYEKVKEALPEENLHTFKVKWDPNGGVTRATHPEYMKEFCETFYNSIKNLIDFNAQQPYYLDNFDPKDKQLVQEIVDHANFCNECVEKFHGRVDLLDRMKNYVLQDTSRPFVVYGESGCGKTSVIAKLASELFKFVPDPDNYVMILRFLGTTPATSNITNVMLSLIYQISRIFNLDLPDKRINSALELRDFLNSQLLYITTIYPEKKLVILLDSIDQLSAGDYNIEWMIVDLPSNVKMFYSTLPDHGTILKQIRNFQGIDESYFLEVTSLNKSIVKTILEDWLNKEKRSLSEAQWNMLDGLFERSKLFPLYVKLVYDIVVKWTSYEVPDETFTKSVNIDKCIQYLFTLLEREHGKMLFQRSMFYMSTFKNGISENELEDILSIDDDVLYEIFEFHAPPVRRFPVVLWARIKHDLSEYMVEKEIDDTRVIYWYHRRFIEVANSIYISKLNSNERESVFSNVIDFFNETWKDKPKPYRYNEHIAKKKNLVSDASQASRNTAIQPTEFVSEDGTVRYNKRKLTELPGFIAQLTANLAIPLSCKHVYFEYDFIHGQFACCEYAEIFDQLQKVTQSSSYSMSEEAKDALNELKLLNLMFLQCVVSISDYPDSLAVQLLSRVLMFYKSFNYFSMFIDQCDKIAAKHCALVAPYQQFQPPGTGTLFTLEKHVKPIVQCIMGADNDSFVFSLSNKIHAFNMSSVMNVGELQLPKLESKLDQYKTQRVYFSEDVSEHTTKLKDISGYVVVCSNHFVHSINFDSSVNFSLTFNTDTVQNIFLISINHVLVSFENSKFFDVYNVYTGALVERRHFDLSLKQVIADHCEDKIELKDTFRDIIILCLSESSAMTFFKVTGNLRSDNKKNNDIKLEVCKTFQAPGINCLACRLMNEKDSVLETSFRRFGLTFEDGSFLSFVLRFGGSYKNQADNELEIECAVQHLKLKNTELNENGLNINLTFLDMYVDYVLCMGDNRHLYMIVGTNTADAKKLVAFKLDGIYDSGCIVGKKFILGIYKGIIDLYSFMAPDINKTTVKVSKIAQMEAHYNDITRTFYKDGLILSTSKDTTIKVFHLNSQKSSSDYCIKFDRAKDEINFIIKHEENKFLSYSSSNNQADMWNASNGRIIDSVDTSFDQIIDFQNLNGGFVAIGVKNENKEKIISIRGFIMKPSQTFLESFYKIIKNSIDSKLIKTSKGFGIVSKTDTNGDVKIQVNLVKYNSETKQWSETIIESLEKILNGSVSTVACSLDDITLTDTSELLVLYNKAVLAFVDLNKKSVLVKKQFGKDSEALRYFKESEVLNSNKINTFYPVQGTNDVITLNSQHQLVYIELDKDNKLQTYHDSDTSPTKIYSFEHESHLLCAYDIRSSKLLGYDLREVKRTQFKEALFELAFPEDSLQTFAISTDCEYIATIQLPKLLSLYRVAGGGTRIAQLPLYSEVNSISMTNEYVAMAMQDRRVITYLIVDLKNNEHLNRLASLESRQADKCFSKKIKNQNIKLLKRVSNLLDESSEEELGDEEIFESDKEPESEAEKKFDCESVTPDTASQSHIGFGQEEKSGGTNMFGDAETMDEDEKAEVKWKNSKAYKNIKKSVKKLDLFDMFYMEIEEDELKHDKNWMLELNTTHNFIKPDHLEILTKHEPQRDVKSASKWKKTNIVLNAVAHKSQINKAAKLTSADKKSLLKTLVDKDDNRINLSNTRKNVKVTNSDRATSQMCTMF